MVRSFKREVCPICGFRARVTHSWATNRKGNRYEYLVYHHEGKVHYINKNLAGSRMIKKGEIEEVLIGLLNSQTFNSGDFQIIDVRKYLPQKYSNLGFTSIQYALDKLEEAGIVEKQKRGRSLFYINTMDKKRLSFVIDSVEFLLDDELNDAMFRKHSILYEIRNDHPWSISFMPFRITSDVGVTFEELKYAAVETSDSKVLKVTLLEDALLEKRVLIKLPNPLLPGDKRKIRIEFSLPEPKQNFAIWSATKTERLNFTISSNNPINLIASLTSSSRNETQDLTNRLAGSESPKWKYIHSISLRDVEPFSVLQLKWTLDKSVV